MSYLPPYIELRGLACLINLDVAVGVKEHYLFVVAIPDG
jgi:hypothetical protein